MINVQRCDMCNGKKKVMGMGMLIKECPKCSGVGYCAISSKMEPEVKKEPEVKVVGKAKPKFDYEKFKNKSEGKVA